MHQDTSKQVKTRCPSYGGCKTLTAATVGVFFFAERISNTGLTGIALEHRPEAVMLCYIVDGPLVQITMEVLIMKQKNENKSDSAVYKSRTEPTQHIVVVNFDGKRSVSNTKKSSLIGLTVSHSPLMPCRIIFEAVWLQQRSNWFQTSKRDRAEQHSWKRGQKLGEQAKFGP